MFFKNPPRERQHQPYLLKEIKLVDIYHEILQGKQNSDSYHTKIHNLVWTPFGEVPHDKLRIQTSRNDCRDYPKRGKKEEKKQTPEYLRCMFD